MTKGKLYLATIRRLDGYPEISQAGVGNPRTGQASSERAVLQVAWIQNLIS